MAVIGGSTRLLTVAQVAERLSVSESWVRHDWRSQGMRPHRIGGQLRFMERELDAWLEDQREAV